MKKSLVKWIERGWQPVFIGFCPSEKAWKREIKRMRVEDSPYPTSPGCCVRFRTHDNKTVVLITINHDQHEDHNSIVGLLVHEAVHAFQWVCESIGEGAPSKEFEAYSIQSIAQDLLSAYADTRGAK
jgi:hypothetical protein